MKINRFLKSLSIMLTLTMMMSVTMMTTLATSTQAAASFNEYYYGSNFYFKVYVPSTYTGATSVPLMVMLHGCTQDPDDFAAGTRMNTLAEQKNFIVLYPEMNILANPNRCWNWFYDYNQHRGGTSEPAIIAGMINWVKTNYKINSAEVNVAGISAGGAMTTIMGATYPDHVKGIGVSAGVMYDAADTANYALTAMAYGSGYDPNVKGLYAYNEMGSYKHRMPVILFHGTSDYTVSINNATEVINQWLQTNDYIDDGSDNNTVNTGADSTSSGTTNGRSWTKYVFNDKNGASLVQYYKITGMGHAWSGGSSSGSYTDTSGPNESQIMWDFFASH
ncbi:extracellular catalytic domain type 1 short-chain-length polyhydroxyalkanoate depolymerase [Brevibacillus dissolubilis]|uniref:extracellular catalytic domain type 1 short-chain-length polyhydroxyalkanoate depolymerase n=1 Tax=Brevibacillus dissolubilis TaxID=1844116 RepID=UPI0011175262|nr:PHB depolymerase family esterase [Brevibacillus dissolubilis]